MLHSGITVARTPSTIYPSPKPPAANSRSEFSRDICTFPWKGVRDFMSGVSNTRGTNSPRLSPSPRLPLSRRTSNVT